MATDGDRLRALVSRLRKADRAGLAAASIRKDGANLVIEYDAPTDDLVEYPVDDALADIGCPWVINTVSSKGHVVTTLIGDARAGAATIAGLRAVLAKAGG